MRGLRRKTGEHWLTLTHPGLKTEAALRVMHKKRRTRKASAVLYIKSVEFERLRTAHVGLF